MSVSAHKIKYPRSVFEEEVLQEIYDGKFGDDPEVAKAKAQDRLIDEMTNEYDLCSVRHMSTDDKVWFLEQVFDRIDKHLAAEYERVIDSRYHEQDHA